MEKFILVSHFDISNIKLEDTVTLFPNDWTIPEVEERRVSQQCFEALDKYIEQIQEENKNVHSFCDPKQTTD